MTMKAKITLIKGLSHKRRNGRTFYRGKPQILTTPSDIAYYKGQPDYSVVMLQGSDVQPQQVKAAGTTSTAPEIVFHSRDKLNGMKKADLISVADSLEVLATGEEKKADLIDMIVSRQNELQGIVEDSEEEVDEIDDDSEEETESDSEEDDEDDEEEGFTEEDLKAMKKKQLSEIAEELGCELSGDEKKSLLIKMIIEAQSEDEEGE